MIWTKLGDDGWYCRKIGESKRRWNNKETKEPAGNVTTRETHNKEENKSKKMIKKGTSETNGIGQNKQKGVMKTFSVWPKT